MVIGLLQARLSIPEARSLKDKRAILRSVKDRLRNKMNISIAETDCQDLWQSAELTVVTVSAERDVTEKRLAEVSTVLHGNPRIVLLDIHTELL